jgi:hypothetical protein
MDLGTGGRVERSATATAQPSSGPTAANLGDIGSAGMAKRPTTEKH